MTPKAPNAIDRLVGSRVRQQRLARRLSLEQLGQALGVTVPQVLKYEKGTNRIGAGRLHEIADLLGAPISFFFEVHAPAEADAAPTARTGSADPAESEPSLFSDPETIALAMAFSRIQSPQVRRTLLAMTRAAASEAVSADAGADEGQAPTWLGQKGVGSPSAPMACA